MTVDELISYTHLQVLNARNLQYLIESPEFKEIYDKLKLQERGEVITLILKNNLEGVRAFVERKKPRQLTEYTVAELRSIAREFDVKDYHLMTKVELLGIINARRMQEVDRRNASVDKGLGQDKNLDALTFLG